MGCNETEQEAIQEEVPIRIAQTRIDYVEESYITIGEVISEKNDEYYLVQGTILQEVLVDEGQYITEGQALYTYMLPSGEILTESSRKDGQVSLIDLEPGLVQQNALVLRSVEPDKKVVETMISSELTKKVAIGDDVQLRFENNIEDIGVIKSVALEPDPFSKLYSTYIEFEDDAIVFGEYAEINFIVDEYEAVMVPSKAIVRKNGEKYIFKYEEGEVVKLLVETGLSKDEWIELVNVDSDQFDFVVSGQNFINQGDEVVVVD
jgi:multidrug efflux pump subunit AcrA (membrane-fusion protein)